MLLVLMFTTVARHTPRHAAFLISCLLFALHVQLTQGYSTQRNLDTKMTKVRRVSFYKCE